jgi:Fic family protein
VWLADRKGNKATHTQPPDPREVPKLLGELCNEWNMSYAGLSNRESKLEAIARFHAKLLLLHPFLDGNGRVARAILMQQCLDLFEKADLTLMNKGADYYEALRSADDGDYSKLVSLIDPIIRS